MLSAELLPAKYEMHNQARHVVASNSEMLLGAVHPKTGEEWDEERMLSDRRLGLLTKIDAHLK